MTRTLLALSTVLAIAVAGCGRSTKTTKSSSAPAASAPAPSTPSSTPAASGASTVSVAANPSGMLMFTSGSLKAKAGKVTIAFTNNAPVNHNFTLSTSGGAVLGATPSFQGGTRKFTVDLQPGTYTFYCSVPGHRAGGMQGTLVVS